MTLKRTPLYGVHKSLGARIVDFAGWEMPVQYGGVIEEHLAVRSKCGLFDVSHMGELLVSGPRALEAVQLVTTNDAGKIVDGQCQYTLVCYPTGGVVDDCIIYRLASDKFLICVNASNTDKAFEWIRSEAGNIAEVRNASDEYAQLALQGPASDKVLARLLDVDLSSVRLFHFTVAEVCGAGAIVSRTGYTGEDGFEIYLAPQDAERVWTAVMEAGADEGIVPAGLGARDTLRLEMGYPLYGHELSADLTPVQAGLHKRFVSFDKGPFIGKEILAKQVAEGVDKTLVGIEMTGPGIPRDGYDVCSNGEKIGFVTSGTHSPSLKRAIAMAYVKSTLKEAGTVVDVMIRNRAVAAKVVRPPFYRKKTVKAVAAAG